MYVCGSIEKFSELREEAFLQGAQENSDFHVRRLAPGGVGVKETREIATSKKSSGVHVYRNSDDGSQLQTKRILRLSF